MPRLRQIDERNVDRLLAGLADRQIADLYDMTDLEVYRLRKSRHAKRSMPQRKDSGVDDR